MNEKEFIYAAQCNGGASGAAKARTYIENNPKDDYDTDDYTAAMMPSRTFKTKRQIGWSSLGDGNRTTCFSRKAQNDRSNL